MYNPGRYIIDWYTGEVVPEPNLMKWSEWFERHHPVRVARTDLPNGITVSTIFLGLDHGMPGLPDYEPELFETMAYDRTATGQSFYDEQWALSDLGEGRRGPPGCRRDVPAPLPQTPRRVATNSRTFSCHA